MANRITSFRDRFSGALAWSNKGVPDDVLIRLALINPKIVPLIEAGVEFGIDKLFLEWENLKAEGSPEAIKVQQTTERILKHIHEGFRQAVEHAEDGPGQ